MGQVKINPPKLAPYQQQILDSKARFTITEASTKSGKTFSHLIWLYLKAHEHEIGDGKKYWWVAPVYSQCETAFDRLKRYLSPSGMYQFNKSGMRIYCPNGAELHFRSAEREDNLYGEDVHAAVFDEAPRASIESWIALRSTLTATNAPCKLIGNFGGISNWVHKLKEKAEDDPAYEYFRITCWDAVEAGILTKEEIEQARKDMPPKYFKELYEAEPSEDEGMLISYEAINNLFKVDTAETGNKYITADVARLGKDRTVIMVWDGHKVVHIKTMDTNTIPEIVETVKRISRLYNVGNRNIIVDEDGIGGGVKDYLRCIGFVNNSRAIKVKGMEENFANLKTQCYWKLAEMINQGKLFVDCDSEIERALTEELEWVRLPKEIDTAKINLMSKDQVKKHLGRSPDYSDALMLRMHFEIRPTYGQYAIR
ncbi:MAG: terminase family protein [Allomuricauda sp.]